MVKRTEKSETEVVKCFERKKGIGVKKNKIYVKFLYFI